MSCEDVRGCVIPRTVTTPENSNKIHEIVLQDRPIRIRHIIVDIGFSYYHISVHNILEMELGMKTLTAKWVPRILTMAQKRQSTVNNILLSEQTKNCLLRYM